MRVSSVVPAAMAALIGLCLIATRSRAQDALPAPWVAFDRAADEPAWAPLLRLEAHAREYRAHPEWAPSFAQMHAQALGGLGLHAEALRAWDAAGAARREPGRLPVGVQALDAVDVIAAAAETSRVVMVNERHHAASDRLLTLSLLAPLHERGFRWLALEALDAADTGLVVRGGPAQHGSGPYLDEPVFAELVREALRLGWHVVAYEEEPADSARFPELAPSPRRDRVQAEHLVERVLRADPDARVLVHAGWAHVHERMTDDWHPLAAWLHELAGVDPFTVDQAALSERGTRAFEHPLRQAAASLGLLTDAPAVLADANGRPLPVPDVPVDLVVLGARTRQVQGRPAWMAMGGRRVATRVAVPEARGGEAWVEAWGAEQSDAETPLDRARVVRSESAWLWLPPGSPVWVRVADDAGHTLRTVETSGAAAGAP